MKKCPTCQKTYDDNLKFCQTDGTLLVEDAPPADPYATMVASRDEILSSMPPPASDAPKSSPFANDDDLLDIPDDGDSNKTMVVSEAERKDMFETPSSNPIPPPSFGQDDFSVEDRSSSADTLLSQPEPPKFSEPDLSPPSFGDLSSSSSSSSSSQSSSPFGNEPPTFNNQPFSNDFDQPKKEDSNPFNSPIPSPFGEQMPPSYNAPSTPPFEPPAFKVEEAKAEALNTPFADEVSYGNKGIVAESSWTPPAAPEQSWGNQEIGQNTPFQPPPAGAGQDQTMAIVSLVLGVLSIFCCGFLTGIPAAIIGFMHKNKVDANPNQFGGRGLALAGIITGVIGTILGIIGVILQIVFGVFNNM